MSKKNMRLAEFGDDCLIRFPNETVDCSRLGYFDDLEYECMDLVKKYAEHFGFEILSRYDNDETTPISFDIAKEIQDLILKQFKYAGVKFEFSEEGE